ncbi:MAG TPA: maleylpyruvate isomerase family mycothiol-dependent enzyme [Friedmanniella sp.]
MTDSTALIRAVRASHDRFVALVTPLSATEVEQPAYASEWSIADTASHLGSQAEIFELFLEAGLAGAEAPGREAFPPIWDRWNALAPTEQVRQSIEANEAFVTRVEQAPQEDRERYALAAFGRDPSLAGLLSSRLSEHALHTWDIAVALDPAATVAPDAVDLLVDLVPATAARGGRPNADLAPVSVVTSDPVRTFVLDAGDPVSLQPTDEAGPEPLTLPAEALVRLVYGRLDPDHTPAGVDDPRLTGLREVFPGF